MSYYQEHAAAWGLAADEEIAGLKTEKEALGYQLVAADQALLEKNAEIEEYLALINRKNTRIAALREKLAACEAGGTEPEPVNFSRVYGSSTGAHTYAEWTQRAGAPLKVRRSYDQSIPSSFERSSGGQDVGKCVSALSFKGDDAGIGAGRYDAQLRVFLSTVPQGHDLRLIFHHEPENDPITPETFIAGQEGVRKIVNEVNASRNLKIRFGGCLMAASTQSWTTSRDANDYFPGADVWDFISWDGYSWEGDREAGEIFDKCVAFCKAKGVEFAVGETGTPPNAYSGLRDQWITRSKDWAKANNCEFWCYWDGSFGVFYVITDAEFKAVALGH